jgi:hypothetical protein
VESKKQPLKGKVDFEQCDRMSLLNSPKCSQIHFCQNKFIIFYHGKK